MGALTDVVTALDGDLGTARPPLTCAEQTTHVAELFLNGDELPARVCRFGQFRAAVLQAEATEAENRSNCYALRLQMTAE